MATLQQVRIQPESARTPSAQPGQTLEFVVPATGQLVASTTRLEFGLSVGKEVSLPAATPLVLADMVSPSRYGGAWGFIKEIQISSGRGVLLSTITEAGRLMSAVYAARYSDSSLEMSSRRGGAELCSRATTVAVRTLVGTCATGGNYGLSEAASIGVTLDLSLGGLGLLGQTLPMDLIGGLRISIRLAEASEALWCVNGTNPSGPSFWFNSATLTASVLNTSAPSKQTGVISWMNISTIRGNVDTARKQLVYNDVAATSATGFLMSFVPSSSLRNLAADGYDLAPVPATTEVSYTVAGVSMPLAYTMVTLDPNAIDQDYVEPIDIASQLFGGQIAAPGSTLVSSAFTKAGGEIPNYFLLGARFDQPVNLRLSPLSVNIVSSVAVSAPMTAYLHVVSQSSLSI